MSRKTFRTVVIISGTLAAFLFSYGGASAYSINSNPQQIPPPVTSVGTLTAPFENFLRSIGNIGKIGGPNLVSPAVVPTMSQNSFLTVGIKDMFMRFDQWLFGVAGFHISGFFTAILNILSWMLGLTKTAVDWVLNIIR